MLNTTCRKIALNAGAIAEVLRAAGALDNQADDEMKIVLAESGEDVPKANAGLVRKVDATVATAVSPTGSGDPIGENAENRPLLCLKSRSALCPTTKGSNLLPGRSK
jgi:hypothetical protein